MPKKPTIKEVTDDLNIQVDLIEPEYEEKQKIINKAFREFADQHGIQTFLLGYALHAPLTGLDGKPVNAAFVSVSNRYVSPEEMVMVAVNLMEHSRQMIVQGAPESEPLFPLTHYFDTKNQATA